MWIEGGRRRQWKTRIAFPRGDASTAQPLTLVEMVLLQEQTGM